MVYRKKIIFYLILGLLIRVIIMPFFTHWDLPAIYEMSHYFSYHHIFDIYSVVYNYNHWSADFPPLVFYTFGGYLWLIKWLMPLFDSFKHFQFNSLYYPGWVTSIQAFRYLFLLKIPYLIFDIFIGFALTHFFLDKDKKIKIFTLWMLNPVSLYITYMFGQFDVIPTALVILSLLLVKKGKISWSFLILGLAIAFKNYPLFFILPALIICGGNFWKVVKNFFLSIFPYFLSILPFIGNLTFRDPVLLNSRITSYFFKSEITIGQGDSLVPFFIIYSLVIFYFLTKRLKKINILNNLIFSYTIILLLFFSFIYFHPQWILWLLPFLVD